MDESCGKKNVFRNRFSTVYTEIIDNTLRLKQTLRAADREQGSIVNRNALCRNHRAVAPDFVGASARLQTIFNDAARYPEERPE